ncbi:MAG: methanogenesis marker 3 protein [Candidatus Methanoplasma sp.]|nr:methanogenesis marker 3 protein [Candidatus Methanoplasma sp.]
MTVNGRAKELKAGATLKDAIHGEIYEKDSLVSIHLSTEKITSATSDFEIETTAGTMVLSLADTEDAKIWKSVVGSVAGTSTRWVTRDISAFGAFSTDITPDRTEGRYRQYDCFFSLGGFDNHTTYVMIARREHKHSYGAGPGIIGKITVGRHVLKTLKEGEKVIAVRPVTSETSTQNVIVTKDLSHPIEPGYSIDTNVQIDLEAGSPASSEQVLVISSKGYINITDSTGSFAASRDDMDAVVPDEEHGIREVGSVTVRNSGAGKGEVFIYKEKRQVVPSHNAAGKLGRGYAIVAKAAAGDKVTIVTEPPRLLSVGLTQADGERFLAERGIKQKRKGDTSDDAVIADQSPEMTMAAINSGEVETIGVPRDKVFRISIDPEDPISSHYFKKVTGLSHKPIGSLKVQFAFPGMPMVTFYGDEERSKSLYPQEPFKKCKKGDIGVTNQSRPHHGLVGIRLQDSKEYGPTGEEPYGTNIVGKFLGDIKKLGELEEEEIIYITEKEI